MSQPHNKRLSSRPDLSGRHSPVGFVLGRDCFARISAIEGIALTDEMRVILQEFDREGLGAEERRRAIIRRFSSASNVEATP